MLYDLPCPFMNDILDYNTSPSSIKQMGFKFEDYFDRRFSGILSDFMSWRLIKLAQRVTCPCAFSIHAVISSVKSMSSERKPITPNPPRWKPNPDPASIVIPGLDTEASTTDQIEQIEQLITIKLQVRPSWLTSLNPRLNHVLVRTSMRTFLKSTLCWRTSSFPL